MNTLKTTAVCVAVLLAPAIARAGDYQTSFKILQGSTEMSQVEVSLLSLSTPYLTHETFGSGNAIFGPVAAGTYDLWIKDGRSIDYYLTGFVMNQSAEHKFAFDADGQNPVYSINSAVAPPPSSPPPSSPPQYFCANGFKCDGTPVTGTPGLQVCGTDLRVYSCTVNGWQTASVPCSCAPTPPTPQPDGAAFISQVVPTHMTAGKSYSVSVTMRNVGTSSWTGGGEFALGAQGPQDNRTWTTTARVPVANGETVAPGATKTFSFTVKAPSTPGAYVFQWAMVHEFVRWFGGATPIVSIGVGPASVSAQDFDGDGKSDLTVWRPQATGSLWFSLNSSSNNTQAAPVQSWGAPGDVPLSGDFDGDGKADLVVWRPSNGTWYIRTSSSGYSIASALAYQWGAASLGDIPLTGDFDGDGKTDLMIFRPTDSGWYGLLSSKNYDPAQAFYAYWGGQGDVPMSMDVDGDGRSDLAIWRPSTGTWWVLKSANGWATYISQQWGQAGDIPIAGDFDGDGKTDLTVFRPSDGYWYTLYSSRNYDVNQPGYLQWGGQGDVPMSMDVDGDGKSDIIVYRAGGASQWWTLYSGTGYTTWNLLEWGTTGDIPLPRSSP